MNHMFKFNDKLAPPYISISVPLTFYELDSLSPNFLLLSIYRKKKFSK
jgi:hypothetical protein